MSLIFLLPLLVGKPDCARNWPRALLWVRSVEVGDEMARCPNCNNAIVEGALICPSCDHPVQHPRDELLAAYAVADRAAVHVEDKPAHVDLICPHCKQRNGVDVRRDGWLGLTCVSCRKSYEALLATVRGKRSRGSKRHWSRDYTVRVKHSGHIEEQIEYGQTGYEDFELRSGDFVAFIYAGQPRSMRVTQNLTIGTKRVVASDSNWLGWIVLLAIGLVIWWFVTTK